MKYFTSDDMTFSYFTSDDMTFSYFTSDDMIFVVTFMNPIKLLKCMVLRRATTLFRTSRNVTGTDFAFLRKLVIRVRLSALVCVPSPDLGWTSARQSLVVYRVDAHGCGTE